MTRGDDARRRAHDGAVRWRAAKAGVAHQRRLRRWLQLRLRLRRRLRLEQRLQLLLLLDGAASAGDG